MASPSAAGGVPILSLIHISSKLKKLGYSFIANTQITSLTIPAGLTTCTTGGSSTYESQYGPLGGANTLKELILEPGMEYIPDNLARVESTSGTHLTSISIPDSVTTCLLYTSTAIIQYNDLICIENGTDTLCNDDLCCIFCMLLQCFT